MKKYLRSKNHIKAQQLVIVGRERKKANRYARDMRYLSLFAIAAGKAIAQWAKEARKILEPLVKALIDAREKPIEI